MATVALTVTFVDELEKYSLLGSARLTEARSLGAGSDADPKKLAAALIHRGWLTPFQVNRVLQGRGDSLMLGPYLLLDRLGQGGMGEVFKARHALMDRVVALKVIRSDHLGKPDCLARFRREMQAAAKLAHPNVVLAHDAAMAGDVYFLAMEYVEGADLARLVKQRGKLPPAEACDYIRQAALGLQHAFERGLVHRDIKPSNLILATPGNVVKILDLGLARLRMDLEIDAAATGLTPEGSVMGTPDYLAPEQAVDARTADIRADIYSLGCTLYHLLTGRPPFPGGSLAEKLLQHQRAEPEALEHLCPDASADLAHTVRRMMAKRPQDRFQTPQEVADALAPCTSTATAREGVVGAVAAEAETVAEMMDVEATQCAAPTHKSQPASSRRHPVLLLAVLALGLAVALSVLIGAPLTLMLLLATSVPMHDDARPEVVPDVNPAGNPEPKPAGVPKVKPGGPPGDKVAEVEKLTPIAADGPAHLIADLKRHTGTVQCLAFSGDGKRLASGADDRTALLWNGSTGDEQGKPLKHGSAVRALAFSPDGKQLAAANYGGGFDASVKLWDLVGDREPLTLPWKDKTGTPSNAQVNSLAFSPDGKRLAAGGGPLRLWELSKGGNPTVLGWQKTIPSYIYSVAFSPDGKSVAAGCHESGDDVRVWTVDEPGAPAVLQGNAQAFGVSHADVRGVVAYIAGGKILARVTSDGLGVFPKGSATVMLWDVDAAKQRFSLRDTLKIPGGAVFALTGDATGRLRVAVAAGNPGLGGGLNPPPAPGEVKLWDEATGKVRTLETGHKQRVTALAFSPDGARLATGSMDQSAKLWDLTR